jgi:hypothetical protein
MYTTLLISRTLRLGNIKKKASLIRMAGIHDEKKIQSRQSDHRIGSNTFKTAGQNLRSSNLFEEVPTFSFRRTYSGQYLLRKKQCDFN